MGAIWSLQHTYKYYMGATWASQHMCYFNKIKTIGQLECHESTSICCTTANQLENWTTLTWRSSSKSQLEIAVSTPLNSVSLPLETFLSVHLYAWVHAVWIIMYWRTRSAALGGHHFLLKSQIGSGEPLWNLECLPHVRSHSVDSAAGQKNRQKDLIR